MKETSKTNKEIFEEKYTIKELSQNPMLCAEAIGYLKVISEYFPSERNWTESYIKDLFTELLLYGLQEDNMWEEFSTWTADNLTEVMKIIDDALSYGFEFKVENHKLYFREVA